MSDIEHILRIGVKTLEEIRTRTTPQAVILRHRIDENLRTGVPIELALEDATIRRLTAEDLDQGWTAPRAAKEVV